MWKRERERERERERDREGGRERQKWKKVDRNGRKRLEQIFFGIAC